MRKLLRRVVAAIALTLAFASEAAAVTIGANFTGSTSGVQSNFVPPDTMGAIGPNHFVELINGRFRVYTRTGTEAQTKSLDQFWTDAGVSTTSSFDPRIVYDPASQRWFAASADNAANANSSFLLAVSATNNPTGSWHAFRIDVDSGNTAWADFPTLGVDANGVYLAANIFRNSDNAFFAVEAVSVPKADLLAATPTIANGTGFVLNPVTRGFSLQPAVDFGLSDGRAAILAVDLDVLGVLNRTDITNAGGPGPAGISASVDIAVAATSFPPDAVQKNSLTLIETNDDRLSSAVQEVGNSLWAVHAISVGGRAALRWYEISEPTNEVLQFGTIADPDRDFYFPSIAANAVGDVVIGFTGSSATEFASSYAVVGSSHSPTTFGSPILLKAGVATYDVTGGGSRNRWGDYSATWVDPLDPFSFWTIQEWASASNTWSTQITQILVPLPVPEPGTLALLATAGVAALTSTARRRRRPRP